MVGTVLGQNIGVVAVVNNQGMKAISATLLLVALTVAACGATNAPAVEQGAPDADVRNGTVAPLVAPSSPASPSDTAPVNQTVAPATGVETRPMAENEVTPTPAPNAPVLVAPASGDRCNGPSPDPKLAPPACPPQ
jgi:hypothetical protein